MTQQSRLTPLMLNALEGLFVNDGLRRNTDFQTKLAAYRSLTVTAAIRPAMNSQAKLYGDAKTEWDLLIAAVRPLTDFMPAPRMVVKGFGTGATTFDVGANVANIVPLALPGNTLTDVVDQWSAITMFNNNLRKFCQYFALTKGQLEQINSVLGPAENSEGGSTTAAFKDTNAQTTGGISELTPDVVMFAQELANAAYAINTADLKTLGDPVTLMRALIERAGGLPLGVAQALTAEDVTPDEMALMSDTVLVPNQTAGKVYRALARVTGVELRQCLAILKVQTPDIATMQDLLVPKTLFPQSWQSWTIRLGSGLVPVYLGATINPALSVITRLPRHAQLIGRDDAVAFYALSVGLRQLTGIQGSDILKVAASLQAVTTNEDLQGIMDLTSPTAGVGNIRTAMGQEGTGPKGMYLLRDAFGTIAGLPGDRNLSDILDILSTINYTTLVPLFAALDWPTAEFFGPSDPINPNQWVIELAGPDDSDPLNPIPGEYIVGTTEAAVYSNQDYIDIILPGLQAARAEAELVRTQHDAAITEADALYGEIIAQLRREQAIRDSIEDDSGFYIAQLPSQKSALTGFVSSLHEYGTDLSAGGASEILEKIVVRSALPGQAIEGAMREGRNIKALREAGISTDAFLPLVDI